MKKEKDRQNKTIVTLQGGLGNQMFQYAAGKCLSILKNSKLYLDCSFLNANKTTNDTFTAREFELGIFKNINDPLISFNNKRKWYSLNALFSREITIYNEPHFHNDPTFFDLESPVAIKGYFNSVFYFQQIKEMIFEDFRFSDPTNNPSFAELKNKLLEMDTIAVHIRRGDYLNPTITAFHGLCTEEYYIQAIDLIIGAHPNATICFFSDDPQWVRETFSEKYEKCLYIEGNTGKDSWVDMYLMSLCKNHVIANSTFSWWGAWLSKNDDKIVVAPKQWFNEKSINTKDIVPNSWIRL